MALLVVLAILLGAIAYAQDFGAFVLRTQLTSYDNTLLDATSFILPPEATGVAALTSSGSLSSFETSSRVSVTPSSSTLTSAALTVAVTSARLPPSTPAVHTTMLYDSGLPVVYSSPTSILSVAPQAPGLAPSAFATHGPVGNETAECGRNTDVSWITLVSTSTTNKTVTSAVHLSLTRRVYPNQTHSAARDSPSPIISTMIVAQTPKHTTCEPEESALPSPVGWSASQSVLPAPSIPRASSFPTASLIGSSLTQYRGCLERTVTKTVYRVPSFAPGFSTRVNGTDVLVLGHPQSACSSPPAWPFYETPQWTVLAAVPYQTQLAPKRQQIPTSQANDQHASLLVRRDNLSHQLLPTTGISPTLVYTTQKPETVLVITTTCVRTITSNLEAKATYASVKGAAAPEGGENSLPPTQTSFHSASLTSREIFPGRFPSIFASGSSLRVSLIASMLAAETPVSACLATETFQSTITVGVVTTAAAVRAQTSATELRGGAVTTTTVIADCTATETHTFTAPLVSKVTQSGFYVPFLSATDIGGVTLGTTVSKADFNSSAMFGRSSVFSSKPGTNLSAFLRTETRPIVSRKPYAASTRLGPDSAAATPTVISTVVTQLSTSRFLGPAMSPAPSKPFTPSTEATSENSGGTISSFGASAASKVSPDPVSLATYDCAPWSSGNDVLVCRINGQAKEPAPTRWSILCGTVAVIALFF